MGKSSLSQLTLFKKLVDMKLIVEDEEGVVCTVLSDWRGSFGWVGVARSRKPNERLLGQRKTDNYMIIKLELSIEIIFLIAVVFGKKR